MVAAAEEEEMKAPQKAVSSHICICTFEENASVNASAGSYKPRRNSAHQRLKKKRKWDSFSEELAYLRVLTRRSKMKA